LDEIGDRWGVERYKGQGRKEGRMREGREKEMERYGGGGKKMDRAEKEGWGERGTRSAMER